MQICIERGSPRCDTANQSSNRILPRVPAQMTECSKHPLHLSVRTHMCVYDTPTRGEIRAREVLRARLRTARLRARPRCIRPHRPNKGALTPFRREAREKDRMVSYGMGRRTVGCGWINLNNLQQPLTFQEQFHFAVLDHSAAISCIPPHDSLFRPHASIFPTS